jgi:membrane protease YdiL (CAAX protease family)
MADEEIAFRGYMQKPLEEAYGIVPAVLIVGIMFWVAHLDHGITITHHRGILLSEAKHLGGNFGATFH